MEMSYSFKTCYGNRIINAYVISSGSLGEREPEKPNCRRGYIITLDVTEIRQKIIHCTSHHGGPGSNPGLVMWDFVMDNGGAGAGFLRELRFPLPIYIPSSSPQSSSLLLGPGVTAVPIAS
jgi:hypothetical protein